MIFALLQLAVAQTTSQSLWEATWSRDSTLVSHFAEDAKTTADQVAAIRALGQIADPTSEKALQAFISSHNVEIRVETAVALGLIDDTGVELASWLNHEPAPAVQRAIVQSIGRRGSSRQISLLVHELSRGGGRAITACDALAAMARRKVPALEQAISALMAAANHRNPILSAHAWRALSRLSLSGVDVQELAQVGTSGSADRRAAALAVLVEHLPADQANDVWYEAVLGPSRGLQTVALQVAPKVEGSSLVVSTFIFDSDPWVKQAAIEALGEISDKEAVAALKRVANTSSQDPTTRALAVSLLKEGDQQAVLNTDLPEALRKAYVFGLPPEILDELLEDSSLTKGIIGTIIGHRLDSVQPPSIQTVTKWITHEDPVVREGGAHLLIRLKDTAALTLAPTVLADTTFPLEGQKLVWRSVFAWSRRLAHKMTKHRDAWQKAINNGATTPTFMEDVSGVATALGLTIEPNKTAAHQWPSVSSCAAIRGATVELQAPEQPVRKVYLELRPDLAPHTVCSFASLADQGFFEDMLFHRIVPSFVVQTGDPRGDGWGGPGFSIPLEASSLAFERGVVGLARSDLRDSGGSQWFVTTSDQPHLTGSYTAFGRVTQGLHYLTRMSPDTRIVSVSIHRKDSSN